MHHTQEYGKKLRIIYIKYLHDMCAQTTGKCKIVIVTQYNCVITTNRKQHGRTVAVTWKRPTTI